MVDELGFDGIMLNEHHNAPFCMQARTNIFASILAAVTKNVKIVILGNRDVGVDCRLTVAGVAYEVDSELAGETVVVWWGLFDQELWVERGEERFGPYHPGRRPIPLHRYRKHRKSRREVRADRVGDLAQLLVCRAPLCPEGMMLS